MSDEPAPKNEGKCPSCGAPMLPETPGNLCPTCVLSDSQRTVADTGAANAPSVEAVAEAFPDLEILEFIGRGGMGAVYQARHRKLDRDMALKILLPDLSANPAFEERFTREARALAKLNHPNIVGVHDFGESGGLFYLTMEFVDGVNLRQAMAAGRFSPEQALAVVPGICDALQAAHNLGILHRDIKPENILLDRDGNVKIADFGIARIVGDTGGSGFTLTEENAMLGSRQYMAPEQLERAHSVDHRADIYSLGVVFYEMLTGELPIGRFRPPSEKGEANPDIDQIVMRALEKELDRRFQTADEVRTEVEGARTTPSPATISEPVPAPAAGGIAKMTLCALGLIVVAAVSITTWFLFPAGPIYLVVGILSGVFGIGAAWLALGAMARGEISTLGKPLLQIIVLGTPVLASISGASGLASEVLVDFGKGSLYVAILIGAVPTFLLARILVRPAHVAFGDSTLKTIGRVATIAAAAILLVTAFAYDGRWPFAHTRYTGAVDLVSGQGAIDPTVLQNAVDEAAGEMKGIYVVDVYGGSSVNIDVTHADREPPVAEQHVQRVADRLLALVPPEYSVGARLHIGDRKTDRALFPDNRKPHSVIDGTLAALAVGGAVTGLGFALLFDGFVALCVLAGAALVLSVIPALPYASHLPKVVDGDSKLPRIEKRDFDPHFSNPEATAMSAIRAALAKDEAILGKAISSDADPFIAEQIRGGNIESLRRANEKSNARINYVEVNIGQRNRHDVVTFGCVLENGEWKIETYRDPKQQR